MSKKQLLAKIVNRTGIRSLYGMINRPRLTIVNFHRIYQAPLDSVFDHGVFSHSTEEFTRQLRWLKRHFKVIGEQELLAIVRGDAKITCATAMITFDDGYKDNFDLGVVNPNIEEELLPEPSEILKDIEGLQKESLELLNEIKKLIK